MDRLRALTASGLAKSIESSLDLFLTINFLSSGNELIRVLKSYLLACLFRGCKPGFFSDGFVDIFFNYNCGPIPTAITASARKKMTKSILLVLSLRIDK